MRQRYYGHFIDRDCKPFKKLDFCPDSGAMSRLGDHVSAPMGDHALSTSGGLSLVGGPPNSVYLSVSGHVRIRRKTCGDISISEL